MRTYEKNSIYFADFETLTYESDEYKQLGHTDVYLWCLSKQDSDEYVKGKTLQEFFHYIESDMKSKTIYFHNLSGDGNFIMKYLQRTRPEDFKDIGINENKEHNFYSCFRQNGRLYNIFLNYRKRVGKARIKFNIRFLCSYNLIPSSIESLGKAFGISKHDEEAEKYGENIYNKKFYDIGGFHIGEKPQLLKLYLEYIERDVRIGKTAYQNYRNTMEIKNPDSFSKKYNKKNILLPNILTAASLAQKIVKNVIYNDDELSEEVKKGGRLKNEEDYNFARKGYSGGVSQFNTEYHNYEFSGQGLGIDINSSYPFAMSMLLPYGPLLPGKAPDDVKYINYLRVEIHYEIKSKHGEFPCIKDLTRKQRYSRKGYGEYYGTEKEYLFIKKIYNIKEVSKTYYHAKAARYLKPFIDKYYQFKVDADKNNNNPMKTTYKIFLNSLYGSFAKKAKYPSLIFLPVAQYFKLKEEYNKNKNFTLRINDDEGKPSSFTAIEIPELGMRAVNMVNITKTEKSYPNMLVGATITSWARLHLFNAIYEIGTENFIYCDTDSIFFKGNKTKEDLPKYIELDNYKLGAGKIEVEGVKGYITGSKRYTFLTKNGKFKFALGGITKAKMSSYDQVQKLLNSAALIPGGKLQKKEDSHGIILIDKDVKLNVGSI